MTQLHQTDCKRIWAAVLCRVARDLMGVGRDSTSARNAAETWVGNYPSKAFKEVCANAGVDYRIAFKWLHALCQMPLEARRAVYRECIVGADAITPIRETA